MFRNKISPQDFLNAAVKGDLKIVQQYIDKKNDITVRDDDGKTALILAAAEYHVEVVRLLLPLFTTDTLNLKSTHGKFNALMSALYARHKSDPDSLLGVVNTLLNASGLDIQAENSCGQTALDIALYNCSVDTIIKLIAAGATIRTNQSKKALIAIKANPLISNQTQKIQVLTCLMGAGLDISIVDNSGDTLLTRAVAEGEVDLVNFLIAQKQNNNGTNPEGDIALILAAEKGRIEIVKKLATDSSINVNAANSQGNTALMEAIIHRHDDVSLYLLQITRLKINATNSRGNTALILATQGNQAVIVNSLLSITGNDVNSANNQGETALIVAAREGHIQIAERLSQERELNFNLSDLDGNTALHWAAIKRQTFIIKLLLSKDANAGIENNNKQKPDQLTEDQYTIHLLQSSSKTASEKLDEFFAKRDRQATRCNTKDERQHTESTRKEIQTLVGLSMHAASNSIQFALAHLDKTENLNGLDTLLVDISNLIAAISDGKKLDKYAHNLLKVAATMGHQSAADIVANFRDDSELVVTVENEQIAVSSGDALPSNQVLKTPGIRPFFDKTARDAGKPEADPLKPSLHI